MNNTSDVPSLAISSIWRSSNLRDGPSLLSALEQTGLGAIELEYRITEETFYQMLPMLKKGRLQVRSMHNYCPLPDILPIDKASGDAFPLSSPDPDVRRLALRYTMKTIEHAAELGARAVVLHLGRVEIEEPMEALKRMYREGQQSSEEYHDLLSSFFKERRQCRQIYLDMVKKNLDALLRRADQLGVYLGLENRYYVREIPTLEEMNLLLVEFSGAPIGHWHDVGHAAVQENLGIQTQQAWLDAYGGSLIGIHLHDAIGYDDHLAPLQGEVCFDPILRILDDSTIMTLELKPEVPLEAIHKGVEYLTSKLKTT